MPYRRVFPTLFILGLVMLALGAYWRWHLSTAGVEPLVTELQARVERYRKVIVLLADVETLGDSQRLPVLGAGQALFRADHEQMELLSTRLWVLVASGEKDRYRRIGAVLDYIEQDARLYDGDQLAFREPLMALQGALSQEGSLHAREVNRRVGRDILALDGIEQQYDREFDQLFSRTENHLALPRRDKWNDYVAQLKALYPRAQILKESGVVLPPMVAPTMASAAVPLTPLPEAPEEKEAHIFGNKFPPKTIALTFDDGPHPKYTAEVVAILQRYHVPGTFFEIGHNIGSMDTKGRPVLGKNADITRKLMAEGYAVGNHSFTHPIMSKEHGAVLLAEINNTDLLLKAINRNRDPIFRFPYGAHNPEGMSILAQDHLQSVLWNVDSLDWADPIPNSVADRVLREVDKVGHGIILFHDIHDRAPKALPTVLNHLMADGYHFAGWDGQGFSVPAGRQGLY
jgi:peptidoglycan/xylan/chitin deacetylase (PgdA/CDA1 family)